MTRIVLGFALMLVGLWAAYKTQAGIAVDLVFFAGLYLAVWGLIACLRDARDEHVSTTVKERGR